MSAHFRQNFVLENGVDPESIFCKLLEDPSPLEVPERDVVRIVVRTRFVRTEPVPVPPVLDRLPVIAVKKGLEIVLMETNLYLSQQL